jgi:membrane fusion protein (multidrug efflux system)
VVEWPAARLIVTAGLAQGDTFITEATGIADGQAVTAGPP